MSIVLTNAKIWLAQWDLSSQSNKIGLDYGAKALPDTRFGQSTEVNAGGEKTIGCTFGGFGEEGAGGSNAAMHSQIGVANKPFSTGPVGEVLGDVMYTFDALTASMSTFGPHGVLMPYSGKAAGSGSPLVRGALVMPKATSTISSNSGTALLISAVAAGQRVYAALHVFAASGASPTLDVTVWSDDHFGFTSSNQRLAFGQATVPGAQWQSAPGPLTDSVWRVLWTIGGGSPSFTFAVIVGIATP